MMYILCILAAFISSAFLFGSVAMLFLFLDDLHHNRFCNFWYFGGAWAVFSFETQDRSISQTKKIFHFNHLFLIDDLFYGIFVAVSNKSYANNLFGEQLGWKAGDL